MLFVCVCVGFAVEVVVAVFHVVVVVSDGSGGGVAVVSVALTFAWASQAPSFFFTGIPGKTSRREKDIGSEIVIPSRGSVPDTAAVLCMRVFF